MNGWKKALAVASLCIAGVSTVAAPAEAAATATVTGTFTSKVGKVLVLTTNGTTYSAKVGGGGKVSIKVPASKVANASVQMVDATGKYLGPVVLNIKKSGTKYKSITGLKKVSSGTLSLGRIAMKTGYAVSSTKTAGGANGVRAKGKTGEPKGAASGGRVKSGGFAPVSIASVVRKYAASTCPDGSTRDTAISGTGAGQDLDCDGVPNAVDVDDNGNGSLDIMDQSTNDSSDRSNYTAGMSTYSGINANMATKLNIHASDATTLLASIKSILASNSQSTAGSFSIAVYLGEQTFSRQTGATPDGVYIECTGIKWCDPNGGSSTAQLQSFTEISSIIGWDNVKWATTPATDLTSGSKKASTTLLQNGLYKFKDSSGYSRFGGFVSPSYSGDDVLSVVRPADVLLLHAVTGGVDTVFTINVSPFFLTTPYISAVTATGVSTNTTANIATGDVAMGTDGKISLSFWRPQRLVLDGESGEATNSMFKSQHGLHYGIGFYQYYLNGQSGRASAGEIGCGGADAASNYVGLSSNMKAETAAYGTDEMASDFWPVLDNTEDTSTDDSAMSFTWDMKNCFTNHTPSFFGQRQYASLAGKKVSDGQGYTWDQFVADPNAYIQASIVGVGAPSTNGYNRSTLEFKIHSPAWTGQSSNGNGGGGGGSSNVTVAIYRDNLGLTATGVSCNWGGMGSDCQTSVANGTTVILTADDNTKTISLVAGTSTPNVAASCTHPSSNNWRLSCTVDNTKGNPQTWHVSIS
mgnify:CR=1 FL=1